MHKNAGLAAEAAYAAHAQGKFFEMHETLFANMRALSRENIEQYAQQIGLDMDRFRNDLDNHTYKPVIDQETAEVVKVGATGTPASFVNGRYLRGAQPFASFQKIVDEELKWAQDGSRPKFTVGTNVRQATATTKQARRGPDPNKVYPIPSGDGPFLGSEKAKVTILHYLDYQ